MSRTDLTDSPGANSMSNLLGDLWHHECLTSATCTRPRTSTSGSIFSAIARFSYVRCEPKLAGMRPDIVVYQRGWPIYVLEFKFFSKPDYLNED